MMIQMALADIVKDLNPIDVPVAFILAAEIVDESGHKKILRGQDIEALFHICKDDGFPGARIFLDVQKIRYAIIQATSAWLTRLDDSLRMPPNNLAY